MDELTEDEKSVVIDWINNPSNEAELKIWMKENWEKLPINNFEDINAEGVWNKVQANINENEISYQKETPVVPLFQKKWKKYYAIAAAVTILFSSYFIYQYFSNSTNYNNLSSYGSKVSIETNTTNLKKTIMLEDGTQVVLNPNASISFPIHFGTDKREVSLTGNAFFEVTKNPEKPFIVYRNNIVTKVLGTSFTIETDSSSNDISVAVHTGRVQVFEQTEKSQVNTKALTSNGVIITPNQKTVYSVKNKSFQTSLVAVPLPIACKQIAKNYFDFNRQSVGVVIEKIQQVYGLEIVLENDALNKCIFTGNLDDENLFEKLDIVSTAINASYEISGTKILLKGKGCK